MKVIRAKGPIFVPNDPEKPDNYAMRLVQTGLIALVPEDFHLDKEKYEDIGKVQIKKIKGQ